MSKPPRLAALIGSAVMLAASIRAFPLPESLANRFRGPTVRVRLVEGIDEHVREGKLYLTLKDFVALVLKNNTEIQLVRLDLLTAADAVLSAKAPFDPSLSLGFNATRTETPQYTEIGGAPQLNSLSQTSQATYQQVLPGGQTINAGFSSFRSSNNSQFDIFNPSIGTNLNFSIAQPLLQNRGGIQTQASLRIARTQLLIVSDQSEGRIADLVASAARQYWDAVQARDNIRVQQLSVDLAQKAYERDRLALELGALSSLEIYQSQSQVAQRKVSVIQAQFAYKDALDGLRRLIGADLNPATRSMEMVLEDDPTSLAALSPVRPIDEAIAAAIAHRPELTSARRRFSVDDLNAHVARNAMLPHLDLGLQFGSSGLGGNQVPIISPLGIGAAPFVPGGLGDSLSQLFGFKSPYYGFSVQLTLPVKSSAAEASLADALVSKARDEYQQRQLEQQIIQEVKIATNQIDLAREQVEAVRLARDLAQKNVEAEQQKYELGGITAFELLDAQNRLASVESLLVNSYAGYQKALISYKRAIWTLLDDVGAVLERPKVP